MKKSFIVSIILLATPLLTLGAEVSLNSSGKDIRVKNIRTLSKLKRALEEINEILKQQKLIEKQKHLSEEERKRLEKQKREKALQKEQEKLDYEQRKFELKKAETQFKLTKFKKSKKYIRYLVSVIDQEVQILKNVVNRKMEDISLREQIKVMNVYKVGTHKYGYVPEAVLSQSVTKLMNKVSYKKKIKIDIYLLEKEIEVLKNRILFPLDTEQWANKLQEIVDIVKNVKSYLSKLMMDTGIGLPISAIPSGGIRQDFTNVTNTGTVTNLNVYSEPKIPTGQGVIKIKTGDEVADNIIVKDIRNGFAILVYKKDF